MVIKLVFDPHVKMIIPSNKTLLLDAQNTQDHGLALLWTRDMPRASQHFYEAMQRVKDGCATPGQCAKACPEHNHEPHTLTSCIELMVAEPSAARRATSAASQSPS